MEFSFEEETILLRDSAKKYLQQKCPASLVRELAEDETGFSPNIWKEIAGLGWLGLIYEEEYGGIDGKFFDLFLLFEEMGRVLLPGPFFCSAVLAGMLINETEDESTKEDLLPQIISGEKIFTVALLDEKGHYDYRNPTLAAKGSGNGSYVLSGTRILVPYAHVADEILFCASVTDAEDGGPTIFRTNRKAVGVQVIPLDTLTAEKTSAVSYDNAAFSSKDIIGQIGEGGAYIEKLLPKATVCKCGEMLGGLESVLEMTVTHVKERHQFGRPLGALQAVQHHCADMATYLETTRLITYQAASLLSEGIPCEKEVAMAKAWCNEAYKKTTWIGHQLHGGIGFTEEHDLHLYYKHAKAAELTFGDARFHRNKIAEQMGL